MTAESQDQYVSRELCSEVSHRVLEKLELIEKRLFRDNGSVSIQTRLDRHEQVIRVILWALSVIGGAFLTSPAVSVVFVLRAVLGGG